MECKIINKEAFKIVGKSKRITCTDGKNFELIPKFWEESNNNGLVDQLFNIAGNLGVIGVCMDFDENEQELTYVIAVEKKQVEVPSDFIEKEIPESTWAVFEAIGPLPTAIQRVWQRIYPEWFPTSGYEHACAPDLEIYYPGNPNDIDYKSEVWIPVTKINSL